MILNIEGRIETDTVNKVAEAMNQCSVSGQELDIYVSSLGGDLCATEALLCMIKKYGQDHCITLFGYGQLQSCAFELFFLSDCAKHLVGGVVGMYHLASTEVALNEKGLPAYQYGTAQKQFITGYVKKRTLEVCERMGMTAKEKAYIQRGNDQFFMPDRMDDFLRFQKEQIGARMNAFHSESYIVEAYGVRTEVKVDERLQTHKSNTPF